MARAPWLKNGLKFSCVQCGRCCQGLRTNVWVNASELKELAIAKNMTLESFTSKFTEKREIRTPKGLKVATSLKKMEAGLALSTITRTSHVQCMMRNRVNVAPILSDGVM